jgi:hypothetical protein
MQTVCGSFTNLLKLRIGAKSDGAGSDGSSLASEADSALQTEEVCDNSGSSLYYSKAEIILFTLILYLFSH